MLHLSKLLPPFYYQYYRYIISPNNNRIPKSKNRQIFILLAADYVNYGDIAITYAQQRFLKDFFPEYEVIMLPASSCYSDLKNLRHIISPQDIITFVGGGNVGDLYYSYEVFRELVIDIFKKNKIIIFPQSIWFKDESHLLLSQRIYNRHRRLLLVTRERFSYDVARKYYKNIHISICPDMVLSLNYNWNYRRKGIITCLRNDKERLINNSDRQKIIEFISNRDADINISDTLADKNPTSMTEAFDMLHSFLCMIASHKILITDRLHGMLFGYITKTPTIVLPNNNLKIEGCYEFIKNSSNIKFVQSINLFEDAFNSLSSSDKSENPRVNLSSHYLKLAHAISEI